MTIILVVSIIFFLTSAHGLNVWQSYRSRFESDSFDPWESKIQIIDGPEQPKPDPFFPELKLYIYSRRNYNETTAVVYRIDLENLDLYAEQLRDGLRVTFGTIFYIYGLYDFPTKYNQEGKFEMTTGGVLFWAYVRRGYLGKLETQYNIILLDWSAYNKNYLQSLALMPVIATVVSNKLSKLAGSVDKSLWLDMPNWHFIGHSLGAHLAGMIARGLKDSAGGALIRKLTALDPASPIIDLPLIRDVYPRLGKDCGSLFLN